MKLFGKKIYFKNQEEVFCESPLNGSLSFGMEWMLTGTQPLHIPHNTHGHYMKYSAQIPLPAIEFECAIKASNPEFKVPFSGYLYSMLFK